MINPPCGALPHKYSAFNAAAPARGFSARAIRVSGGHTTLWLQAGMYQIPGGENTMENGMPAPEIIFAVMDVERVRLACKSPFRG